MGYIRVLWTGMAALVLCGCSETKYVPEGEYLLHRVKVECEGKYPDVNASDL